MLLDVEDPLFVKFGHAFLNEVNFQLSYSLLLWTYIYVFSI